MYSNSKSLGVLPAILDVRRKKLYVIDDNPKNDYIILAKAEAQLLIDLYFEYFNKLAA